MIRRKILVRSCHRIFRPGYFLENKLLIFKLGFFAGNQIEFLLFIKSSIFWKFEIRQILSHPINIFIFEDIIDINTIIYNHYINAIFIFQNELRWYYLYIKFQFCFFVVTMIQTDGQTDRHRWIKVSRPYPYSLGNK